MSILFDFWLSSSLITIIFFPFIYKSHYDCFRVGDLIEIIAMCLLCSQIGLWLSYVIPEDILLEEKNKNMNYFIFYMMMILSLPSIIFMFLCKEIGLSKRLWQTRIMNIELL